MQVNGTLHYIAPRENKSDNFIVRNFILITDQNTPYPQHISMQCVNQKCDLLDKVNVGEKVSVDFNLQGRLVTNDDTKAFNNLQAWKIEKVN